MHEDEKELLDAAPPGTDCVTTVTSSEAGPPAVIINHFAEDKNGQNTIPIYLRLNLPTCVGITRACPNGTGLGELSSSCVVHSLRRALLHQQRARLH